MRRTLFQIIGALLAAFPAQLAFAAPPQTLVPQAVFPALPGSTLEGLRESFPELIRSRVVISAQTPYVAKLPNPGPYFAEFAAGVSGEIVVSLHLVDPDYANTRPLEQIARDAVVVARSEFGPESSLLLTSRRAIGVSGVHEEVIIHWNSVNGNEIDLVVPTTATITNYRKQRPSQLKYLCRIHLHISESTSSNTIEKIYGPLSVQVVDGKRANEELTRLVESPADADN